MYVSILFSVRPSIHACIYPSVHPYTGPHTCHENHMVENVWHEKCSSSRQRAQPPARMLPVRRRAHARAYTIAGMRCRRCSAPHAAPPSSLTHNLIPLSLGRLWPSCSPALTPHPQSHPLVPGQTMALPWRANSCAMLTLRADVHQHVLPDPHQHHGC
eukprot:350622-Chlamydomonas_euryale.AAC.5